MLIDLLPVVNAEGRELLIDEDIDLSGKSEYGIEILSPTKVCGRFFNIAGSLEFSGSAKAKLRLMCDRCGEWFDFELEFEFSELLKKELDKQSDGDENPDIIFYEGSSVDIAPIIYNNLYMNLPTKKLCNPDCKGLCSVCGGNLNEEECDCTKETIDPRFDILDSFFKE